jgi:hypothetical protein
MSPRVLISIVFVLAALPAAAQKQPVQPADFGKWESLGAGRLSPDGGWFAYDINRVNEQRELRVRRTGDDTARVFTFATGATFTGDSKWLGFSIGVSPEESERLTQQKKPVHNRFALLDLTTGDTMSIPAIASFQFSSDGRFVALRGYPPEGRNAADVVVRELATGRLATFGNVSDSEWSDVGALLAFTVQTVSGTGNGVQLYDAATGTLKVLDSSDDRYRGLAWRDEADDLVVLRSVTDSAYRDTTHHVLAWKRLRSASPASLRLDAAAAAGTGEPMRIAEHRPPSWSEDGATVYVGLRPREPKPVAARTAPPNAPDSANGANGQDSAKAGPPEEKASDVQVWHAQDVRIIPMQKSQEQIDLRRTLLAAWHPADGRGQSSDRRSSRSKLPNTAVQIMAMTIQFLKLNSKTLHGVGNFRSAPDGRMWYAKRYE